MKENNTGPQQYSDQLSDILLVLDKGKKQIRAVKGINEKGQLETVSPDKKNQREFMRVDRHGDIFSNFFSNFLRQLKSPTRFSFFKVSETAAVDTALEMQKHVDAPTKKGEALMAKHEVMVPGDRQQGNKKEVETQQPATVSGEYRYKPEQIDWETMSNLGLGREKLEKMNLLDPLLRGFKTNVLVPVSLNLGTVIIRSDARLSLQPGDDGRATVAIHCIRKEPELNKLFFGHEFTGEDKDNLLKTGNMGRVVDLKNPKTGEIMPSIISVDRLTNELVALRTDKMRIPEEIKGVRLDDTQKRTLMEGKPLDIKGMLSKKGQLFDAGIQYNADKRSIEFLFDRSNSNKQVQKNGEVREAPRIVRGKELSEEQYQKFRDGERIYIPDLVTREGKEYKGYLKFNRETGGVDFSFNNPDKLKEKVQPANKKATGATVNSEHTASEASQKEKEPKSKKQQELKPARSRGIKR